VSRYDFTTRILELAGLGHVPLTPITLAQFKRDSTPPPNGGLTNFAAATMLGIKLRPWPLALADFFESQSNPKSEI
jgi:dTDP-4-dehydrorhamnose reductase